MTDNRVRAPLNGKTVDLAQLDVETGGHGLSGSEDEVVAVEGSPVDEATLAAAVAAHVPPTPPATPEEKIAELVDAVSVLTDLTFSLMEGL